jgi:hypothetical protein
VRNQVNALSSAAYFNLLATLMKDNPAAEADAPMLEKMARLGIVPGQPFDLGKFIPMLRLYWPKETPPSIIDGTWNIPAVQNVN